MSVQLHILKHQGYNINGQFKYAQAEINPIISVLADDDITYSDDGLECSFYCPECGEVFTQGDFDYDYGTGLLNFECPCCGWYGTENEVGQ